MFYDNLRSALISIFSNKARSLLTVLGIVIGVTSVTILIALGEGLKKDVSALITDFGTNIVAVVPGVIDTSSGSQQGGNPISFITGDILTLQDVETIRQHPNVRSVAPMSIVPGILRHEETVIPAAVLGSTPDFLDTIEIFEILKGSSFAADSTEDVILITQGIADRLGGEEEAVGRTLLIGREPFEIVGVLGLRNVSALSGEFELTAIVPFDVATRLNNDNVRIMRIVAQVDEPGNVAMVQQDLRESILKNHKGEEDFTVLTQDEMLGLFNQFLDLATVMVSAIAAVSLLVGGIGIMNIMLVTVTERTREIGLRKAVGATRRAILSQFLVEAVIITLVGGLIGLLLALGIGALVAIQTPLTPVITWKVVALAVGISTLVGVIFGLWPALRAANKDPIEALRSE